MIEKLAHHIVDKYIDGTDLEKDKCKYSIYGILSFTINSIFAVILSLIFGYSNYIFFIIAFILYLREMSAGAHAQSARICAFVTNLNYLLVGISIVFMQDFYLYYWIMSFCIFFGLDKIPRYTKNAAQHNAEKQALFRGKYVLRICLLFLASLYILVFIESGMQYIWILNLKEISVFISGCFLINKFYTTDLSFWILDRIK